MHARATRPLYSPSRDPMPPAMQACSQMKARLAAALLGLHAPCASTEQQDRATAGQGPCTAERKTPHDEKRLAGERGEARCPSSTSF
jgi:hypothetical protein